MGDLLALLDRFNLGAVNTILLAALYFVLKYAFSRIAATEKVTARHGTSIAFIKGRLKERFNIEEQEE